MRIIFALIGWTLLILRSNLVRSSTIKPNLPKLLEGHPQFLGKQEIATLNKVIKNRQGCEIELVRVLGGGKYNRVWLAKYKGESPFAGCVEVAVKELRVEQATPLAWQQFENEVRALLEIKSPQNPYVVDIYDYFEYENVPYIVMEYCLGGTLEDRYFSAKAQNSDQLPPSDAHVASWMQQLCLGLAFLHKKKIIHGDLRPANLLIGIHNGKPVLKLCDFGQALVPKELCGDNLLLRGDHRYAAPETLLGGQATPQSDIYSAGAIMYRLLTRNYYQNFAPGKVASEKAANIELVVARATPIIPPHKLKGRLIKAGFSRIAMTALNLEPWRRYRSVEAMGRDLERALAGDGKPRLVNPVAGWLQYFVPPWLPATLAGIILVVGLMTSAPLIFESTSKSGVVNVTSPTISTTDASPKPGLSPASSTSRQATGDSNTAEKHVLNVYSGIPHLPEINCLRNQQKLVTCKS